MFGNNLEMKALQLESDNHANQFIQTFSNFSQTNTLTDVTLVSDDKIRMEAHKIILCAGSSIFQDFFVNNNHGHPMLYLRGIKHKDLKSILEFLYSGKTRIPQIEVSAFLSIATELKVYGLENEVEGIVDKLDNFQKEEKDEGKLKENGLLIEEKENPAQAIMTEENSENLKCQDCDFKGMTTEAIYKHRMFVHAQSIEIPQTFEYFEEEEDSQIQCTLCVYVGNKESMKNHQEKVHQLPTFDILPFGCGLCQFSTDQMSNFKKHARDVHYMAESNLKTKCIKCEKSFCNSLSLSFHWKTIHSEKRYSCDSCEYITNRKDSLRDHKTKHHDKNYKFKCNECGFGTIRKHYLLNHQAVKHNL